MKILVRPNTWGLLLVLCGLFTSINGAASVCYGIDSSGDNTLEISLTSNTNYSQTPTPTSSWTTGAFTLCWPSSLGPNIISSFTNLTALPYAFDFTPTLVGANYCQKFTFIGPAVLDLTSGVVTDVVQINLNTSCAAAAGDFFIENFPSDPPVANGTASLINFFGEEFAVGGCTLTTPVGLNANAVTATPVDVSTCGGLVNIDAVPGGGSGVYTGFTWSDLGTGTSSGYSIGSIASQTLTVDASAATSGTINLEVVVTDDAGCQGTGTVTVTVAENATADAGPDQTLCGFQSVTINAMANGPGMWSGGTGSIGQATNLNTAYTPAAAEVGTTVTLTWTTTDPDGAGSCTNASDTVDITFVEEADAGTGGTFTFCSTDAMTNITPTGADAGGTFTPALASGTGMFNPAVDGSGTYTYTVPGTAPCPNETATVSVTVNQAPSAGTGGTFTFCSTDAMTNITPAGADAGGSFTPALASGTGMFNPAVDAAGTYTYTVAGTAPCASASASVSVSINQAPNAGADGSFTFCSDGAMTNIAPAGADAGGSFTPALASGTVMFNPAVDAAGTYVYTVAGAAPCGDATASIVVMVNQAPNAGNGNAFTFCSNFAPSDISPANGDAGGTITPALASGTTMFDPAVDAAGTYTYTITGTTPCTDASTTIIVSVNQEPNPGADAMFTFCTTDAAQDITPAGADAGSFSPALASGGTVFDPAVDAAGSYSYTVLGNGNCIDSTSNVTVVVNTCTFACPTYNNYDLAVNICDPATDGQYATWSNNITTMEMPATDPDGTWTAFVISNDPTNPSVVFTPPTETHSGADLCASELQEVYALGGCDSDLDGTADVWTLVGTYSATLFPASQAPIITDDAVACMITIQAACANDVLSEAGPIDYNGQAAGALDVLGATATNEFACTPASYDVTHAACSNLACPMVAPVDMPETICDGGLTTEYTDWQNMVETNNPATDPDGTFNGVFYSDDPNMIAGAPVITGVHSGADVCQSEMQMAYAFVGCDLDGDGMNDSAEFAGMFSLTIQPASQAPMIVDDQGTCTITVTAACPGDALSVQGPLDYSDQAAGALDVTGATATNMFGCTVANYDINHGACIFFQIDAVQDPFGIDDPCTCNNDASAPGAGDGTFSETVTVTGPAGLMVRADATSTGLDIAVPAMFIETSAGMYELIFNHVDGVGYSVGVEYSSDGGATWLPATDAGLAPLAQSNVCAYPSITSSFPASLCNTAAPITIGDLDQYFASSSTLVSPATGFVLEDVSGPIAGSTIDPAALTVGTTYFLTVNYMTTGTGNGGTVGAPAEPDMCEASVGPFSFDVAMCSACPTTSSEDCAEELCSGSSSLLTNIVIENDNGTGAWYLDAAGTQAYTGGAFDNLTCDFTSESLFYVVMCDSDGDGTDEANLLLTHSITVYPTLVANEMPAPDCGPVLVEVSNSIDAAAICATYQSASAPTPVCPNTTATATDMYSFDFFDGSICEQHFSGLLTTTCMGSCSCPTTAAAAPTTEILCGNGSPSFPSLAALGVDDLANAEVTWSPSVTFVVTATCTPRSVVFTPTITCSNDCSISFDGPTHTLTVYPDASNFTGVVGTDGTCGTDPSIDLSAVLCLPLVTGPTILEPTIDGCAANGMPMPDVGEVQYEIEIPAAALSPDGCNAYSETLDLVDDPCDNLCPVVSDFCELTIACASVSDCDPATGTYSLDVSVVYQLTAGDQIDLSLDGGTVQSVSTLTLGSLTSSIVTFSGLSSDAGPHVVTASVVDASGQCTSSATPFNYLAPADCTECAVPNAGTPSP